MLYHVTTGANGNLYVEDNGRSSLLMPNPDNNGYCYDRDGINTILNLYKKA